jgi:hypothetical protein
MTFWDRRLWLVLLALACLAPTPGDIGGCGQPARLLGPRQFFEKKRALDCAACSVCEIRGRTCSSVCTAPVPTEFPRGCFPLVHDGEVCLRALSYSSCDDYVKYLDDRSPQVPTECDFCPLLADGGVPIQ